MKGVFKESEESDFGMVVVPPALCTPTSLFSLHNLNNRHAPVMTPTLQQRACQPKKKGKKKDMFSLRLVDAAAPQHTWTAPVLQREDLPPFYLK